ncbi:inositol monophosphatase family protein [Micromonospora sp. WMMD1128]|uniref:inositol monophosphatase family protein n=1 Tax=unclassified Micromonospora TaxID=2617518 RepID=UPI00248BB18D|nr:MULTISPECIES: inositol monophosphatase family protein [unclassified Micromonospora]WBB76127.1 inositol monophosphatase family protein [Micromonospora sp. WMMD1128]WFE36089.1 inositol monophosphatase family protein [Micromonospora sp. WMMD975]
MSVGGAPGDLRHLSLRAARAGADAIRQTRHHGFRTAYKGGAAQDPVTTADHASERAILDLLARDRPQDAVLAEESGLSAGCSGLRWIVDPLDGTLNFSHGASRYAVSVAVAAGCDVGDGDGRVVAATVLQPASGAFLVLDGDGPHDGDAPVAVNREATPGHALVAFAVPNAPAPRRRAYQALVDLAPRVADLRNSGSTVCDLASVATGELDAFVSFDPAPWDIAAGTALVEAGGGVSRRWRRDRTTVFATGAPAVVEALADWLGPDRTGPEGTDEEGERR